MLFLMFVQSMFQFGGKRGGGGGKWEGQKLSLHVLFLEMIHDSQKRNQMLHLRYNCIVLVPVLVHLLVDWLQARYTKRNHKGIF